MVQLPVGTVLGLKCILPFLPKVGMKGSWEKILAKVPRMCRKGILEMGYAGIP